jgi:hypothetical protein
MLMISGLLLKLGRIASASYSRRERSGAVVDPRVTSRSTTQRMCNMAGKSETELGHL